MPPKNKGKKGKKGGNDDDFWYAALQLVSSHDRCHLTQIGLSRDKAGESVPANNAPAAVSGDVSDGERPANKGGFSSFAALGDENPNGAGGEEEEEDFGGFN